MRGRTFGDISDEMQWEWDREIEVCRDFIDMRGLSDELVTYARAQADDEINERRRDRGMTRIHVLAWGVPESSAGFDWVPVDRDPGGEENLRRLFDLAVIDDDFVGYAVLAEVWIAGYAPDEAGRARVTDVIEGELQDAIGAGLVGKILGRY